MKKKRLTEEQIIGILREQEAGAKAADLARKYAVSETTLYNWKAKFGGTAVGRNLRKCIRPLASGRCCGQAMMRFARIVPTKWYGLGSPFF